MVADRALTWPDAGGVFPAAWLGSIVEQRTGGRLTLGDAQGTLWRGSAFIGGAAGNNSPVTPLLPGRFSWKISPLALVGMVECSWRIRKRWRSR
jgi:general secretion pathway protein N